MEFHALPYLREIFIILAAVGIIVPLLSRQRINQVIGYLIAGFAVGPYGLGSIPLPILSSVTITNPAQVAHLAEFGVVFLLFMIGLEISPRRLWDMRKMVFGLGFLQVALSATLIGPLIYFIFNTSIGVSVVLGSCLALSSTAIVMQLLMDRRKLGTPLGRACFSILLFQDLAVVPILISLGVLAAGATAGIGMTVLVALGKAVGMVLAILVAGHFILRPLFRIAGGTSGSEPFMAIILLTVLFAATLTGMAGMSMALGAFLAGVLLAETEYRHSIEVYIEPFKGVFLGVFFMTVGMGIDPTLVEKNILWLCAAVITLLAVKGAVITTLARVFGLSWGIAVEAGLLLGQAGEFAFVIVGGAMALGLVVPETGQFILIMTSLSMMLTPMVSLLGKKARVYLDSKSTAISAPMFVEIPELQNHIIVAGAGRVGRSITRVLGAESIPYISIESNPAVVEEKRKAGKEVFYGDASRHDLLEHFHPEKALAIVLTMDDSKVMMNAIRNITKYWPNVPVYARARDMRVGRLFKMAGASLVVAETVETSLQLTGHILKGIGVEEGIITRRLQLERANALAGIAEP